LVGTQCERIVLLAFLPNDEDGMTGWVKLGPKLSDSTMTKDTWPGGVYSGFSGSRSR
jgi:hypothetical protein